MKILTKLLTAGAIGLGALVSSVNGAITAFVPTQSNLVTNPIVGMSQIDSDYVLSSQSDGFDLNKAFNTDNAETFKFDNFATTQDAASLDNSTMYQLGTNNSIYKVDMSTGNIQDIGALSNLDAGANSFGLGAVDNSIYSFNLNGSNEAVMTKFSADTGANLGTTNFGDLSSYGTLTGAEAYKTDAGNIGFLLTTKDDPSDGDNFVLDFNTNGSFTGNGLTIVGADLEDITYDAGNVSLGFTESFNRGGVQRGSYVGTAVPEPSSFGLLGGLAALGYVASQRRRRA
jgi:hypothetical protein